MVTRTNSSRSIKTKDTHMLTINGARFVTVAGAAKRLNKSIQAIRYYISEEINKLPAQKVGRAWIIKLSDLESYIPSAPGRRWK